MTEDKDTEEEFSTWEMVQLKCEWFALRWGWVLPTLILAWWACGFESWCFYAICLVGLINNYGATKAGWCLALAHMDDEEDGGDGYDL